MRYYEQELQDIKLKEQSSNYDEDDYIHSTWMQAFFVFFFIILIFGIFMLTVFQTKKDVQTKGTDNKPLPNVFYPDYFTSSGHPKSPAELKKE